MTEDAQKFVTPLTFEALSGRKVHTATHNQVDPTDTQHIGLTERADLMLVAPATNNILAKISHGLCDDLVSLMICAAACPVIFAPSMNQRMWENKIAQENVSKLKAKYGIVFDSDDPGFLFTKGPSSNHMEFRIHGLESHAGVAPEEGISAIKIAAEGLANMKLGRIDQETTANIGQIEGGMATNIIPNLVVLKGEARSHSEQKLEAQTEHMKKCLEDAAAKYEVTVAGKTTKASVESHVDRDYSSMDVPDSSHVVQLVIKAAARMGLDVKTMASGGGCDANVFNRKGIECANLGTGMRAIHTVKEWLDVKDMYASAEMTLEIMKLNGELAAKSTATGA